MVATVPHYYARGIAGQIDTTASVIRDVAVVTEGVALGHGVSIDATTLEQVKAQAETYSGGLKVKMDHGGGAADIVGFLTNFRIARPKLIADFHVLSSTPHRDYIFEIASKIPDTFGMSIAFSGPTELGADKKTVFQRCSEIYSCDLVSEPAANASGLFAAAQLSEGEDAPEITINLPMNDETKKAIAGMIESAMMGLGERLSKLEASFPKTEDKDAAMSARNNEVKLAAETAALAAVKEFTKSFGAAPVKASAPAEAVAAPAAVAPKKFEEIVAAKAAELKGDKGAAIAFCIANHQAEYVAYRARVQGGEIIKL